MQRGLGTVILGAALALTAAARAETFGTGANQFTLDFVWVGNPGNTDDAGAGGGSYSSPYGGVPHSFAIGATEVSEDMVAKATASGMANVAAGMWTGNQSAAKMSWYEAAAFTNWLSTSTRHQAAYNLTWSGGWSMALWSSGDAWQSGGQNLYRHKDAYYFLPSEDEWYKAAYHQNDGVTANYWDYPTASNTAPDGIDSSGDTVFDAVFWDTYNQGAPNTVTNAGDPGAYGTVGQGGNVWEWMESAWDGANDSSAEDRAIRGACWDNTVANLRSSVRSYLPVTSEYNNIGFRVASVPEPSGALLLLMCGGVWAVVLRRGRSSL